MIKDETIHFIFSVAVGVVVGYFTGHWWAIGSALLSGFLIDADHLLDYLIYTKFRRLDLKEFFDQGKFFDKLGKVYVLAHGFEYAIILIILAVIFPNLAWLFYSLGFANLIHLLYDTFANDASWPAYFITFRISKNFDHNKLWIAK
ncbi:MAG: hypothetical protein NTY30_00885 [Candidatus Berkelbacteria bacterium]|nr:hypothetical protein [Candidatus Berkelbacteria bacterium]